jgi:serine/threonine protein kinase
MKSIFGTKIGDYFLLEQLGEGGMAKVYNALDLRLERNIAIKVILPSKRSSQFFLQQFEQEAKALANLNHTNIVKVLDYGFDQEQPYLVMDFIQGGTLKQALREPLPWQKAAEILAPIARALDYVHSQKIIHRDIKPSNILLDEDYRPLLSDFGVVKLIETKDENNTPAISVGVGTPDYMSPEQALGRDLDFRADIYSLGIVFYELITGKKPFSADTPMAIVIKHTTDEFPRPRKGNKSIPTFVEDAILRAVEKDPAKRYRDMGQFADVLEMISMGKKASPKKIKAMLRPPVNKKKPLMILASSLLILLGMLILVFSNSFLREIDRETSHQPSQGASSADDCTTSACPEEKNTSVPTATSTRLPVFTATHTMSIRVSTDVDSTPANVINQNHVNTSSVKLIGESISNNLPAKSEVARWGIGSVNKIAWSPDGSMLATGTTSGIFLYDAQAWKKMLFINPDFHVVALTFTADGQKIIAGSNTGRVNVWDVKTGQMLLQYNGENSPVTGLALSPGGKNIAIGYLNGRVRYFDIDSNSSTMLVSEYPSVFAVGISADGRFLYASNGESKINVWDISQKKIVSDLSHSTPIRNFKLSNDRSFMLSAGTANIVYLWDLSSARMINSFSNLGSVPMDFDFSGDDSLVVIALSNGDVKLFTRPGLEDYSVTQTPLFTVKASAGSIFSTAFSPQQARYATGNLQDGLKIWDAENGGEIFALNQSMSGINQIYFSADGHWLSSGHEDNIVRIWKIYEGQIKYQVNGYLTKGIPFSPDNQFLVVVRQPEKRFDPDILQVVNLENGNIVAELPGYIPKAHITFTADSKLLVMGTPNKSIIWDVATWEKISTHGGMNAGCGQFFTPQSDRLAVISDAGIFFKYDEDMAILCGTKPNGTTLVHYFPQQKRALFVLGDGGILNWRFEVEELKRINLSSAYSLPDEIFLGAHQDALLYAIKDSDNVKIYTYNGSQVMNLSGQNDYMYRVAFSSNASKLFALGSRYGSIHIWTLP